MSNVTIPMLPSAGALTGAELLVLSQAGATSQEALTTVLAFMASVITPPSTVLMFASNAVPAGWLQADGSTVSQTTYAALYTAIGTTFNTGGEAAGMFRLPDLRGEFLRGYDDGRGVDPSRIFGSAQNDLIASHQHDGLMQQIRAGNTGNYWNALMDGLNSSSGSAGTNPSTTTPNAIPATGGSETRPKNVALLACIKY